MNDDLISRQAAIDALHMHLMYRMGTDSNKKRLDDWINGLPSAQPKKGKWISLDDFRGKYNENGYKCSECDEHSDYKENFCPNCGADMRQREEQNG